MTYISVGAVLHVLGDAEDPADGEVPQVVLAAQHVDDSELQEGAEDEDETGGHPHVNGLRVGHPEQRVEHTP